MQWIMEKVGYGQTGDVDPPQKSATASVSPPASQEGIAGESKAAERVEKSSETQPSEDYVQPEAKGTAGVLHHEAEVSADSVYHEAKAPADYAETGVEFTADPIQHKAEAPAHYGRHEVEIPADNVQHAAEIPADNVQHAAEIPADNVQHAAEIPADNVQHAAEIPADSRQHEAEIPADYAEKDAKAPTDPVQHKAEVPAHYGRHEQEFPADNFHHEAEIPPESLHLEAETAADSHHHETEVPADHAKFEREVFADPGQQEAEIPADYAKTETGISAHNVQHEAEVLPADYVQDKAGVPLQQHDAETASHANVALPPSVPPSVPREQAVAQETWKSESSKWDGQADEEVLTGEQTLMKVPGTVLHLVDEKESVLLAQGDFVLSRIMQEGREGVIIARVGEQLKWPIVTKESTVKLDRTHYFFAVEAPSPTEENPSNMLTLNYGLTLPHSTTAEEDAIIEQLDHYLDRYSTFTAPTIVTGDVKLGVSKSQVLRSEDAAKAVVPEELVSGDGVVAADEQESAAFWTTMAPNVNDYNGKVAKSIASGTGYVIQDIFWLSDAAKAQLDSGHDYMKAKFQPNRESSQVSPATIGAMRSVRKVTESTDKVADGILSGILNVTGTFATKVVESKGGQKVFNTNVGQAALASMEAFGSLFDAVERAGRNVAAHSSSVTQDFVNHRYGESARQLTDESFKSVGHATSVVWSVVKLHKVFTPSSFAKSSARSAVKTHKGKTAGAIEEEDPSAIPAEDSYAEPDPEPNAIPEQDPSAIPGKSPSISRLKKVE